MKQINDASYKIWRHRYEHVDFVSGDGMMGWSGDRFTSEVAERMRTCDPVSYVDARKESGRGRGVREGKAEGTIRAGHTRAC